MYAKYLQKHVRPFVGKQKAGAVGAEVLDSLYAELRRCRIHCTGDGGVDHRTPRAHVCDGRCRPHRCNPLSSTTIRPIHFLLRAAFEKGVRWRWVGSNPVLLIDAPAAKAPDPRPPSPQEAARIVDEAFADPDWGTLVWLTMTTGARRGELCALRWSHVDLDRGTITIRRVLAQFGGELTEKDTKTHQQRRLALDSESVTMLTEHWERCRERAAALDTELGPDAFVFSLAPDSSTPLLPSSVSQRYRRLAAWLGIDTQQFTGQGCDRLGVDPLVDRLVRHPASLVVGVVDGQPARDRGRGPTVAEQVNDDRAQPWRAVDRQLLGSLQRRRGLLVGRRGPVSGAAAVPVDLAGDHRPITTQPSGDLLEFQAFGQAAA